MKDRKLCGIVVKMHGQSKGARKRWYGNLLRVWILPDVKPAWVTLDPIGGNIPTDPICALVCDSHYGRRTVDILFCDREGHEATRAEAEAAFRQINVIVCNQNPAMV